MHLQYRFTIVKATIESTSSWTAAVVRLSRPLDAGYINRVKLELSMLKHIAAILVLVVGSSHVASAQSVRTVLSAFELLGSWSHDCGQAPTVDNQRLIFSAPVEGDGTLNYEFGPTHAPMSFVIKRATDLSAGRVLIHAYQLDDNSLVDTVLERLDGKIRIVWSRESDSGKVLMRNGTIVSSGMPENWLSPCQRSLGMAHD
jgi:hypothetical protein